MPPQSTSENETREWKDFSLRALVLFGLLNTLPFPLSILLDIFGNTLGAISQVLPLGFHLPPMFGFLDSILRSQVIDLVATPIGQFFGVPEYIAYFGPESPTMLVWFALTLAVSLLLASVWARFVPRPNYEKLRAWAHLWFRWFLASMMLRYGAMKVFDSQFGDPIAQQLLTPAGELSRMQLLWMVFGASRNYELFCGAIEMAGALLLLSRRTAFAGLLLLLGALAQIVLLNWMCGISVKFVSAFLFGVNLVLLVPYWPRISGAIKGKPTSLNENLNVLDFVKSPAKMRRIGWVLTIAYLFAFHLTAIRQSRFTRKQFPARWFHGAWEVIELNKNGERAADEELDRWRHLSFDTFHRFMRTSTKGERSTFFFSYDDDAGALNLNAMGPDADQSAWKGWTVLPGTAPGETINNPGTLELRGSIGPDRFVVRAKRLRFRLLGEE